MLLLASFLWYAGCIEGTRASLLATDAKTPPPLAHSPWSFKNQGKPKEGDVAFSGKLCWGYRAHSPGNPPFNCFSKNFGTVSRSSAFEIKNQTGVALLGMLHWDHDFTTIFIQTRRCPQLGSKHCTKSHEVAHWAKKSCRSCGNTSTWFYNNHSFPMFSFLEISYHPSWSYDMPWCPMVGALMSYSDCNMAERGVQPYRDRLGLINIQIYTDIERYRASAIRGWVVLPKTVFHTFMIFHI